jgi:hypothetical protein
MAELRELFTIEDIDAAMQEATALARSGDKAEACYLLQEIAEAQPDNEAAWLWLALCTPTKEERLHALQQVVAINPANARAQRLLAQMQETPWQILAELRHHRHVRTFAIGAAALLALILTLSLGLRVYRHLYRQNLETAVVTSEAVKVKVMQTATARAWNIPTWTPAPTRTPRPTNTRVVSQEPSVVDNEAGAQFTPTPALGP